jgi:hypothetical protein
MELHSTQTSLRSVETPKVLRPSWLQDYSYGIYICAVNRTNCQPLPSRLWPRHMILVVPVLWLPVPLHCS